MRRLHSARALTLLTLAACGPNDMSEEDDPEPQDPVMEIAACGADRPCGSLSETDTTMCALERIQSGEPAYITFPFDFPCWSGSPGKHHLLIRDAASLTVVDEYDVLNDSSTEEAYVYDVAVDPELVAEQITACQQAVADGFECKPCEFLIGLGEGMERLRFSCDA